MTSTHKGFPLVFPNLRLSPSSLNWSLLLRQIVASDRPQIFQALSHPLVIKHYGISYQTEADTQEQMDWYRELETTKTGLWWGICDANQPHTLLGACGIYDIDADNANADIGYWLLPDYWGRGIMQITIQAVLHYAFSQLKLHRIEAEIEPENIGSRQSIARCGFEYEGKRREVVFKENHYLDLEIWGLLQTHFFEINPAKHAIAPYQI